jgi:hypothetical protein
VEIILKNVKTKIVKVKNLSKNKKVIKIRLIKT